LLEDDASNVRTSILARITTPWNYQFDFKLDRSFKLSGFPLTAFIYIQNLFNRKNVQHVYWRTGSSSVDGSFDFPGLRDTVAGDVGEEFFVLYDLINHGHRQHYEVNQGGDLFGRPREIRFGLQIGFGTSL